MEVAELILGFVEALAWPAAVVFLLLKFRSTVERIFKQLGTRLGAAESVELGLFGQDIKISGTAKELIREASELESSEPDGPEQGKVEQIQGSLKNLVSPLADSVGTALLKSGKKMTIVEVVAVVALSILAPGKKLNWSEAAVAMFSREVEKVLEELVKLQLAATDGKNYWLTKAGDIFFNRVFEQQANMAKEFKFIFDRESVRRAFSHPDRSPKWSPPNPSGRADD
jgi:hypothetical protein